jgi:hypothetical protein
MVKAGVPPPIKQRQQGFMTEDGVFLSRRDAYVRAVECGQIKDDGGEKILLSEMLY